MKRISVIVAMDNNHGIGKNNDLMWHLPRDMKFFKSTTENHVVIMGRKNYDSIPEKYRPLSNRENVIITRNPDFKAIDCLTFLSIEDALRHFEGEQNREIFIIGGGEIYKLAMSMGCVDQMYITHVNGVFDADTFFPDFDTNAWESEMIMVQDIDENHSFSFKTTLYHKRLHK
jgi:dihydrofolate reductase